MDDFLKKRIISEANYILKTKDTIRSSAEKFNISKSTLHNDLTQKLKKIDPNIYDNVNKIFKEHFETKHIRGGQKTKERYKKEVKHEST